MDSIEWLELFSFSGLNDKESDFIWSAFKIFIFGNLYYFILYMSYFNLTELKEVKKTEDISKKAKEGRQNLVLKQLLMYLGAGMILTTALMLTE